MTQIQVTSLDFPTIKANLIAFMKQNPTFSDYDFTASGLNFLTDVLAYNTSYNAVLANFVANESFLDSAVKRSSVISHALALGYHSKGHVGARAKINITISTVNGASLNNFIIRRGAQFTCNINGQPYSFVTVKDETAALIDGKYSFYNVEIVEGTYNTFSWYAGATGSFYTIPNPKVDTSTIMVQTYATTNSVLPTNWQLSTTLYDLTSTSKAFFTQEQAGYTTQIYFGNGTIGATPDSGSVIRIEYVTCNGSAGNGANTFTPVGSILNNSDPNVYAVGYSISTVIGSMGGVDPESVDSIKYNASKHFTVQNRAVTAYDYASIIREGFNNVGAIKVWGGEDNVPPQYNSVMICIKPSTPYQNVLTIAEKNEIASSLKGTSIMNIRPVFVDPEYVNVLVNTSVTYNPSALPQGANLTSSIAQAITNYSTTQLEQFNNTLAYSTLVGVINNASSAITSNLTSISLYKTIAPQLGKSMTYQISFMNGLLNTDGYISSSSFTVIGVQNLVTLENRGSDMVLVSVDYVGKKTVMSTVGTIDYVNGFITLNAINITSFTNVNGGIQINATPLVNDVQSQQNNVIRINTQDVNVSLISGN